MTPHIEANLYDYAPTVLMPGDPLRAKWIAETFLSDVKLVNTTRNCLGYTGTFNNKPISIQASGMGQASLGIYATELFKFYNVETIIRVGTCGSFLPHISVGDLIFATTASSDTNLTINGWNISPHCNFKLLNAAISYANDKKYPYHVGSICSTDFYYNDNENWWKPFSEYNILGVDMETYLLYLIAMKYSKHALTVNTVSNNLVNKKEMNALDRQQSLISMVDTVLNII